jgi:hypothetical protein
MPASYQNLALDLVAQAPTLRLRIVGTSMTPLLRDGDFVILQPLPVEFLRPGDLIAFRCDGDTVTHRLIAIQPDGLLTRGDNLPEPDPLVSPERVLGRAISLEKNGHQIRLSKPGWAFAHRILAWSGWQTIKPQPFRQLTPFLRGLFWCIRWLLRVFLT